MEIHIRLAGVQLGPYTEEQVRQHLEEGLLSLNDPAKYEGDEDWVPLSDIIAKMQPPGDPLLAATQPIERPPASRPPIRATPDEVTEAPRRAPEAPPGVTHLPMRQPEPQPNAFGKKTGPLGPTSPDLSSPSGKTAFSIATTTPLANTPQGTKKVARTSLVKALAQKTAPLPSRASVPISAPPSTPAPEAPETSQTTQPEAKKSLIPSLIQSLTAKTVPLRSVPAAPPTPPSRGTLPVTTPLPTKPVTKPPSGTIPPPSVVNALTKKLGQMVMPDPVQTSPPTLGLLEEVATTKLPPPESLKKKAAEKSESLTPVEPTDEPVARPKSRRTLHSLIYAFAALALLLLYYVWSPYHAASKLRNALSDGDPAELTGAIDFDSVRASLKEQIESQVAQLPASALSVIEHSIDAYITADGISGLVKNPGQAPSADQGETILPDVAAKLLSALNSQLSQSGGNQGLAAFDNFVIGKDILMLHLQFQGLGWKLKRVDLQPDLLLPSSSGATPLLLTPVVDTYLESGNTKSDQGNWDGAIADFTQVLAIDPRSSIAFNDRGAARQSKGDLDGAAKDFSQALAIDSQMAIAYVGRGNTKAARNDLDGAIADFTQALHLNPTLAVAFDSRGNAVAAKGDFEAAIADFTQAITIDPKMANAFSDRGFARQANGNIDGAIADYTQALALKPQSATAYYSRGLALMAKGSLVPAIADFDKALSIDPKLAGAFFSRGNAKNALHQVDDAIADYTQAVTLNPKLALAFGNRGLARQSKGDLDGAVADFTLALAVDPKIAIAYYNRGLIKVTKGDYDGAIADSTQAIYLDPKNAQAYYNRGLAKLIKSNLEGAQTDLKQFCDLAPRDRISDHAHLYLWVIAKEQNPKTDADQELSDVLENGWNSPADDFVSKTATFLLGRLNEADYLAAAASTDLKIDQGQHCEAWYFAGMKRLLLGDRKGAMEAFRQSVATGQKDYCEYILAQAELQALETAPPPLAAPVALPAKPH